MGKKQRFKEDILLEAVVKYAEVFHGKIKATELAKWANENIPELEGVEYYHFTRSVREKDKKTGIIKERVKKCTERINEINQARSLSYRADTNVLLCSSNPAAMFELPINAQKKLVLHTRELFYELRKQCVNLRSRNSNLEKINDACASNIKDIDVKISGIEKKLSILEKQVRYLLRATDEKTRRELLKARGIEDGSIDFDIYIDSLKQSVKDVSDINKNISKFFEENPLEIPNQEELNILKESLTKELLEVFDE